MIAAKLAKQHYLRREVSFVHLESSLQLKALPLARAWGPGHPPLPCTAVVVQPTPQIRSVVADALVPLVRMLPRLAPDVASKQLSAVARHVADALADRVLRGKLRVNRLVRPGWHRSAPWLELGSRLLPVPRPVLAACQGALQLAADGLYLESWLAAGCPVGASATIPDSVVTCMLHGGAKAPNPATPTSAATFDATPTRRTGGGNAGAGERKESARVLHTRASASLLMASLCPTSMVHMPDVEAAFSRLHHAVVLLLSPSVLLKDATVRLGGAGGGSKEGGWIGDAHRAAVISALGCLPDAGAWVKLRSSKWGGAYEALRVAESGNGRDATQAPLCFGMSLS